MIFPLAGVHAVNYYLSPDGDDSRSGISPDQAWATLQEASSQMGAGDTLFIMGGTYSDYQRFHRTNGSGGAPGSPLVIKAYGDDVAIFQWTGYGQRARNAYFYFEYGSDYVTIDGFSYLNPSDSLFIKLEGHEDASYVVRFIGTPSNYCEHITVRGIEIDGDHEWDAPGGLLRYGFGTVYARYVLVESNYFHHIFHATGDLPGGDGTDRAQSVGEAMFLISTELSTFQRNTVSHSNHACITFSQTNPGDPPCRYNKIRNNRVDAYWGGGIYIQMKCEYNLIEGNVITHCGETTTKTKGALYIIGSNNTVRKNVTYCPVAGSISLKGMVYQDFCFIVENNLVYNNTCFGGQGSHLNLVVINEGVNSCPEARVNNNTFANNIFYKSWGNTADVGNRAGEVLLFLYNANEDGNWIEPDQSGVSPSSTHWGGNLFYHNIIRKDEHPEDWEQAIIYLEDSDYGGFTTYSIAGVEANDPLAWFNNYGDIPQILSEDPDALYNDWWRLLPTSPCIDRGMVVNETNGAYVNAQHPGFGWADLEYLGTAPDIGAYETDVENPAPLSIPVQGRLQSRR
jgi:hypothetical protein